MELEIERKLGIKITLPLECYFCGEDVVKRYGRESKSLCFHSLDGDHENWIKENKVPAHKGCHQTHHHTGLLVGDDNPRGFFGKHHSDETKQRMSEVHMGHHHTEETKQKIREAHIGRTVSEETRQKLREALLGKTLTEEHKQKLREAWETRKPFTEEHKRNLRKAWEIRRIKYPPQGFKPRNI